MRQLSLLFFLFVSYICAAQAPEKILEEFKAKGLEERTYIHFDRNYYHPGETIWLKGYIFSGSNVSSSTVTKLELVDVNGKLISSKILPIVGGTFKANIDLPKEQAAGKYFLRSFTRRTMNLDPNDAYIKMIPVIPAGTVYVANEKAEGPYSVSFNAEGGQLIAGVLTNIAFVAKDKWGRPVNVEGAVLNSKGQQVAAFESIVNGMGKFEFVPKANESYTATYKISGTDGKADLPAVRANGVGLLVTKNEKGHQLLMTNMNSTARPAMIYGIIDNSVAFKMPVNDKKELRANIPTKQLVSGILQLIVVDDQYNELARRNVFVNNDDYRSQVTAKAVTISNKFRAKNEIELIYPDTVEANVSLSVIDLGTDIEKNSDRQTLFSAMMLDAQLNEHVYDAAYYFEENADAAEGIDLVMLNNSLKWDLQRIRKVNAQKVRFIDNFFIDLNGTAWSSNGKELLPNSEISFILETGDSSRNVFNATSDDKGLVNLNGLIFQDSATVWFQNTAKKARDKRMRYEVSSQSLSEQFRLPFGVDLLPNRQQPLNYRAVTEKAATSTGGTGLQIDSAGLTLEAVTVVSKKKNPTQQVEERYTTGVFANVGRRTEDFINNPPNYMGGNVFDYMRSRYSYINVVGTYPDYILNYRQTRTLTGGMVPMQLFLDEVPATPALIASIPMHQFAMIKIFSTGFVGGEGGGGGGAVAFYTKKAGDVMTKSDYTNLNSVKIEGFSATTDFSMPEYGTPREKFIKKDTRTTLLWDPLLIFNEENKSRSVPFFNSDKGKRFLLTIEGVAADGKLMHIEKTLE